MNAAAATRPVRVVLADDHDLVRSGIKALLSMIKDVEVIAEARNGQELITLAEELMPEVVMTDISMPGMDGIAAIAHLSKSRPQVRLLVLSMYDTVDFVKRAVASGACGYLMKDAPPFELEQAIRSVMATGTYFSPMIAQRLLQPSEPTVTDELTERQIEILRLIAQGKASKEIAFELGLSPKTVDVHRANVIHKMGAKSAAELQRMMGSVRGVGQG